MADIDSAALKLNQTMTRLDSTMSQLVMSMKALVSDSSKASTEMEQLRKSTMAATKTTVQNANQTNAANANYIKSQQFLASQGNAAAKATRQHANQLGAAATQNAKNANVASAAQNKVTSSTGGLLGKFNLLAIATTFLTNILMGGMQRQQEALKTFSGMLDYGDSFAGGLLKLEADLGMVRGLNYDAAIASIKANRQVITALGGTAKALQVYDDVGKEFFAVTGNINDAFKLTMSTMTQFAAVGVKPTSAAMSMYLNDLQQLSTMTELSTDEIASLYKSIAEDSSSMLLLKSARADEREAILASQRAMINNSIAMGMSAEQAGRAAKMLNGMVAASPIERLKQAAKLKVLGGAMGIAGSEEAAAAVTAGPRATAEQKTALADFSTRLANATDQARGAGLASEIFTSTLLDKLDMNSQFGPQSDFSTTLGNVMQRTSKDIGQEFRNAMGEAATDLLRTKDIGVGIATNAAAGVGVAGIIGKLYDWIVTNAGAFFTTIGDWAKSFGTMIKTTIVDPIIKLLTGIVDGLFAVGKTIAGVFGAAWDWAFGKDDVKASPVTSNTSTKQSIPPIVTTSMPVNKAANQQELKQTATATQEAAKSSAATASTAATTGGTIAMQLQKMVENNKLLQNISDTAGRHADIAEKTLAVLTMSEREKSDPAAFNRLREGNRYSSNYAHPR